MSDRNAAKSQKTKATETKHIFTLTVTTDFHLSDLNKGKCNNLLVLTWSNTSCCCCTCSSLQLFIQFTGEIKPTLDYLHTPGLTCRRRQMCFHSPPEETSSTFLLTLTQTEVDRTLCTCLCECERKSAAISG